MFDNKTSVTATKKVVPDYAQIADKIKQMLPGLEHDPSANYFVEIHDELLTNYRYFNEMDDDVNEINRELITKDRNENLKIGLVFMGKQSPGGQNVVDGLLRYQEKRGNVELVGFKDGVRGLFESRYIPILRETYANFNNLGGYDYLGRGPDALRTKQELEATVETCNKLGLSGLVLVGATSTLTDAVYLANYFNLVKCPTRVIVVPASVDGNIHHKYVQTAIGFDTCSKFYSQLIGNMLTDSASAIKYWYFIRLMGNQPSHMALECALKTCPNLVLIAEESVDRKETLRDIVDNICEVIVSRANDKKNYGCILIPEGLLSQIASFDQMIIELNQVFSSAKTA